MIQLYFLSILCNGLTGYLLISDKEGEFDKVQLPIKTPTFYLVLGILSTVTGILKLLSPIPSSLNAARGVLIFGDFIPAVAGIAAGIVLLFGLYRKEGTDSINGDVMGSLDRIGISLLALRKPLGLALMGVALFHFVFAEILFL